MRTERPIKLTFKNEGAMSQFAYRIQPTRIAMLTDAATEREADVIAQHFKYLSDLTAQGQVLFAGRTLTADEDTFGLVVVEAESEAAARHLMVNDPAVAQGVMRATLWPFRVALWASRIHAPCLGENVK